MTLTLKFRVPAEKLMVLVAVRMLLTMLAELTVVSGAVMLKFARLMGAPGMV